MKAFHWDRILVGTEEERRTNKTVVGALWVNVVETKIDAALIEMLLSVPAKRKKKVKKKDIIPGQSTSKKIQKMRVLEAGRAQTVAITLSQLPEIPVIVDAIAKLDSSRLTLTNIVALGKLYPTPDEQRAISDVIKARLSNPNENTKGRLVWDRPESLFIALAKIPSCPLRLSCWSAHLGYEEQINDTLPPIKTLEKACNELQSSKRWKIIMGTILAIGNYMNGGTKRGRADGFKIGALLKLESTKLLKLDAEAEASVET